ASRRATYARHRGPSVQLLAAARTDPDDTPLIPDPARPNPPLARGADEQHLRRGQGPGLLDDAALGIGARRPRVPLLDVDALHHDPAFRRPNREHLAFTTPVLAADDLDQIAFLHMEFAALGRLLAD